MVGLWLGRRWAEYLTLVATVGLLIPEILELTKSISVLKLVTLVVNVAVVALPLVRQASLRSPRGREGRGGRT